jgi:hypothetical protein
MLGVRAVLLRSALGLAMMAALCFVAPATATIVPGRGMAGITLRMTESQVRSKLGGPLLITRTRGALGFLVTRLHYRRIDVDLQRLDGKLAVIRVLTTRPAERTESGVGVGSPIAAVERLAGARCWWEASMRYCGIGRRDKPFSHFTMFWIGAERRVTLISVLLIVNS